MTRILWAASIFALAVPAVAAAQPQNDKHHGEHASRPQNGGQHAARPVNGHAPARQAPARQAPANRSFGPEVRAPAQASRPSHSYSQERQPSGERSAVRPMPSRNGMEGAGSRPSNFHRVHAAPFRYPRGYRYRRWSIGLVLPSLFLSNSYFYNDWAMLGAYPPPPGFVWVRYGPDLLLVSRRSGRIRDVIYGAFY